MCEHARALAAPQEFLDAVEDTSLNSSIDVVGQAMGDKPFPSEITLKLLRRRSHRQVTLILKDRTEASVMHYFEFNRLAPPCTEFDLKLPELAHVDASPKEKALLFNGFMFGDLLLHPLEMAFAPDKVCDTTFTEVKIIANYVIKCALHEMETYSEVE
eukprot:6690055-Pyramimonas_sp.AAC.1